MVDCAVRKETSAQGWSFTVDATGRYRRPRIWVGVCPVCRERCRGLGSFAGMTSRKLAKDALHHHRVVRGH